MKSGISTSVHYIISRKTVVCVITTAESQVERYILHMDYAARQAGISTPIKLVPCPREFKGIARYKPGDEKNIALAKEIARKKAMRKMYKIHYNKMKTAAEYFGMAWGRYLDTAIELANKANEIDNEIVKLTSKESQG